MDELRDVKSDINQYQENIEYFPIVYDDFRVYCFEYLQKTLKYKKLHYHNGFEIGICLEGEGVFIIENRVYKFKKNSVIFIPSSQPHIAQSPDETPSEWKYLTFDWENVFGYKEISYCENVIHNDDMAQLVLLIYNEVNNKADSYQYIVTHLLKALIYQLMRYENVSESQKSENEDYDKVYSAICYICNNYNQKFTIEDLAAANNYSVNYFRKIFKLQTGMTPLDYVINFRLKMASILLRSTNKSILEVSEESGFTTLSSFNRYFKQKYNMTPSQWRKNNNG